jgi:hypothetical protein
MRKVKASKQSKQAKQATGVKLRKVKLACESEKG